MSLDMKLRVMNTALPQMGKAILEASRDRAQAQCINTFENVTGLFMEKMQRVTAGHANNQGRRHQQLARNEPMVLSTQGQPQQQRARGRAQKRSCWICGSTNHLKRDCPKKDENQSNNGTKGTVNHVQATEPMKFDLTNNCFHVSSGTATEPNVNHSLREIVIDSGSAFHIFNYSPKSGTLKEEQAVTLTAFDGSTRTSQGSGVYEISIEDDQGTWVQLSITGQFVPEATCCLLSTAALANQLKGKKGKLSQDFMTNELSLTRGEAQHVFRYENLSNRLVLMAKTDQPLYLLLHVFAKCSR